MTTISPDEWRTRIPWHVKVQALAALERQLDTRRAEVAAAPGVSAKLKAKITRQERRLAALERQTEAHVTARIRRLTAAAERAQADLDELTARAADLAVTCRALEAYRVNLGATMPDPQGADRLDLLDREVTAGEAAIRARHQRERTAA